MAVQVIKYFTALFIISALTWHPIFSADKYILPVVPFLILMVARGMIETFWRRDVKRMTVNEMALTRINHISRFGMQMGKSLPVILLAFLLLNAIYIGRTAFQQVTNNVHYLKGDRYAGYPSHVRAMFEEFERVRGLPDSVRLICRKPELLWLVSGRQSEYPKGVVR